VLSPSEQARLLVSGSASLTNNLVVCSSESPVAIADSITPLVIIICSPRERAENSIKVLSETGRFLVSFIFF